MAWFLVEFPHLKNKQHPLFHWKRIIILEKNITYSYSNFLGKKTSGMKKLCSLPNLQSKEKASSPSSIEVESSQVSTENYHISNVVGKNDSGKTGEKRSWNLIMKNGKTN